MDSLVRSGRVACLGYDGCGLLPNNNFSVSASQDWQALRADGVCQHGWRTNF